jgi:cytidylate kinase
VIIAIDGPAGAGKSTVARGVAAKLGFTYLDTGAMYRCVRLAASEHPETPAGELAERLEIELGEQVRLDGEDVTARIREPGVSEAASRVAADPAVRAALVKKQQRIMAAGDWVAEGRDIGTVVAPDAAVKVFLHADPDERARRRASQIGLDVTEVLKRQRTRDERDSSAGRSTLEAAPDAIDLDTTQLSLDEVIDQVVMLAVEAKEIGA